MKNETVSSQLKALRDNIAIKKQLGKDTTFEEGLEKEWSKQEKPQQRKLLE